MSFKEKISILWVNKSHRYLSVLIVVFTILNFDNVGMGTSSTFDLIYKNFIGVMFLLLLAIWVFRTIFLIKKTEKINIDSIFTPHACIEVVHSETTPIDKYTLNESININNRQITFIPRKYSVA